MRPKNLLLLIIITLLSSCATLQRGTLWKKGKVKHLDEMVSFPFEEKWGMIFLEVDINGQNFNFLLDTGAPNVIDKKALAALNLDAHFYGNVTDAYGNSDRLSFAITKDFEVGPLLHKRVGALIADFRSIPVFDCMEIDGLLGSNMMRKAVWQFDFKNKMIHVAPDASYFDLSKADKMPIGIKNTGTPVTDIDLGSTTLRRQTVDFGSGNGITILKDNIPASVITDTISISLGDAGTGLYGTQQDTVLYLRTDSLQIGSQQLTQMPLRVRSKTGGLLGLQYWKNFTVTIDWQSKLLYTEPYENSLNISSNSFGFGTKKRNDSLFVSSLTIPSPASEAGMELSDFILKIDDQPVREMEYCELLKNLNDVQEIEISILQNNQEKKVALKKRDLLKN